MKKGQTHIQFFVDMSDIAWLYPTHETKKN